MPDPSLISQLGLLLNSSWNGTELNAIVTGKTISDVGEMFQNMKEILKNKMQKSTHGVS